MAGARLLLCALALALAAVAAAPALAAPSGVRPLGAPGPLGDERLSDERTLTRYAHSMVDARVRRDPRPDAPVVGRLRALTEDGLPEVYLARRSFRSYGRVWIEVRLPQRPNGRRGWVRREALGPFGAVTTFLRVDRRRLRATLFDRGRIVWRARVGIGAVGTPTPAGSFYVRERLRLGRPDSVYGPWAFGTSAYSVLSDWPGGGVVGIHGTNAPHLIPGRPSHGCIRVRNRAIRRLARLMPVGTPIRIE